MSVHSPPGTTTVLRSPAVVSLIAMLAGSTTETPCTPKLYW